MYTFIPDSWHLTARTTPKCAQIPQGYLLQGPLKRAVPLGYHHTGKSNSFHSVRNIPAAGLGLFVYFHNSHKGNPWNSVLEGNLSQDLVTKRNSPDCVWPHSQLCHCSLDVTKEEAEDEVHKKPMHFSYPGASSLPAQPFHRWKPSKSCSNLYQLLCQSPMSVRNCCSTTQPGSLLSLPCHNLHMEGCESAWCRKMTRNRELWAERITFQGNLAASHPPLNPAAVKREWMGDRSRVSVHIRCIYCYPQLQLSIIPQKSAEMPLYPHPSVNENVSHAKLP